MSAYAYQEGCFVSSGHLRKATLASLALAAGLIVLGLVWWGSDKQRVAATSEKLEKIEKQTEQAASRVVQRNINPMPRLDVPPEVLGALTEANFRKALAAAAASPDGQAIISNTNPMWAAQIVLNGQPNSVPSAAVELRMQNGARNVMQMTYSSKFGTVGTDVVVGSELKHNDEEDPKFAAARTAFKQAFDEVNNAHGSH